MPRRYDGALPDGALWWPRWVQQPQSQPRLPRVLLRGRGARARARTQVRKSSGGHPLPEAPAGCPRPPARWG